MILRPGLLWAANPAAAGRGVRYEGDPRHFSAYNLVGLWLTWQSTITLNGTDVSAMSSLAPGGNDLVQGTAANQPLFTGAPAYNSGGTPSIQFTAATNDQLLKLNTDIAGTGPVACITAVNMTVNGAIIGNSSGVASGFTVRSDTRTLQNLGAGGRTFQAAGGPLDTTVPHVVFFAQDAGEVNGFAYVDRVAQAITPGGTIGAAPGAGGAIHIGSIDGSVSSSFDWIGAAWFRGVPAQNDVFRMSRFFAAQMGAL